LQLCIPSELMLMRRNFRGDIYMFSDQLQFPLAVWNMLLSRAICTRVNVAFATRKSTRIADCLCGKT